MVGKDGRYVVSKGGWYVVGIIMVSMWLVKVVGIMWWHVVGREGGVVIKSDAWLVQYVAGMWLVNQINLFTITINLSVLIRCVQLR